MSEKDGGPEFPIASNEWAIRKVQGMTVRDVFAGMAMSGLVSNDFRGSPEELIDYAWQLADMMLSARESQK